MSRTTGANAAYMAEYRRKRKLGLVVPDQSNQVTTPVVGSDLTAQDRIRELEGEVHRLKAELAQRPPGPPGPLGHAYSSRPFTPVPKSGQR